MYNAQIRRVCKCYTLRLYVRDVKQEQVWVYYAYILLYLYPYRHRFLYETNLFLLLSRTYDTILISSAANSSNRITKKHKLNAESAPNTERIAYRCNSLYNQTTSNGFQHTIIISHHRTSNWHTHTLMHSTKLDLIHTNSAT